MVDLAQVLARHWPDYLRRFGEKLLPSHRRAVQAILSCRTAQLGGKLYACAPCDHFHYAYHSCNHRACPKCGHHQATLWIEQQKAKLLPVPYFLVTFTLPAELRPLARAHQQLLYSLFLTQSARALQDIARDPKHLGVELGLLAILQTWTRDLRFHLHSHLVVPGGGLTPDHLRWRQVPSPDFLLPEKVLATRFRTRFRHALEQHPELFAQVPSRVWYKPWVADVIAVGRGESALKYLSAYIYKTAFTSQRLLGFDDHSVTFTYQDRITGQSTLCRLPAHQFIHRLLQHVLPRGFQRVRYFGWLAAAATKRRRRILALLDYRPPDPPLPTLVPPPRCPHCQRPMLCLAQLPRPPP